MRRDARSPLERVLYVIAGACPASIVLRRACKLRSAIYPKREGQAGSRHEVTV